MSNNNQSHNHTPEITNDHFIEDRPTVILIIGMAGSGKTTFMQRLSGKTSSTNTSDLFINLDPAVLDIPYNANLDIRDTVNYRDVMKQYNLGPNGSILTCLNLFATKFEQVLSYCEKRYDPNPNYIFVDTPGQIEVFTWSASGSLITEALASSFPTILAFIIDTPRCQNPKTFMTNMLQACSIVYRTRLPMLLVFNKCDIIGYEFAIDWMEDFNKFHDSLGNEETYSSSLSRSLSLVLEEFYKNLASVDLSALTGLNMDRFFKCVKTSREEYFQYYFTDLVSRKHQMISLTEKKRRARILNDPRLS
jgi:hypothetical protein